MDPRTEFYDQTDAFPEACLSRFSDRRICRPAATTPTILASSFDNGKYSFSAELDVTASAMGGVTSQSMALAS
jgi:hypothetical protein